MALDVIHVDESLVIVDKPAGLLSVPGRLPERQDCVVSRLQAIYPDALTVHRLDQVTSGLIVHARGKAMQRVLAASFERRRVRKEYLAVVEGDVQGEHGEIDLPLICDWPNRPKQKVDPVEGKPALTRWRVLGRHGTMTRVALEPVTGRSHQLRLHLGSIGHPIVGDVLYGARPDTRVLLHAHRLAFPHPLSGTPLEFESPPPF